MRIWILTKKNLARAGVIALVALVAVGALYWGGGQAASSVFGTAKKELPVYSVEQSEKKIAISFEAAWGDEKTSDILSILDEYQAKCTFFLVGFWVDKYPEHVKEIDAAGHEIGNHSTNHPHMASLSEGEMQYEIKTTSEKITALTGKEVKVFRPPFGEYNDSLIKTCKGMGIQAIQWDVDSLDWKEQGVQPMVDRVLNNVKPGSIVLFHNNSKYITEALPTILKTLKDQGYEIVSVSDLLLPEPTTIDTQGMQHSAEPTPTAAPEEQPEAPQPVADDSPAA